MNRINSHDRISHADIDQFGYDWSKTRDASLLPQYPTVVHFPKTGMELISAIEQCGEAGFLLRGAGHSDNDLITVAAGEPAKPVISTWHLRSTREDIEAAIADVDPADPTITIKAGTPIGDLDDWLGASGWGLPVRPDHPDITVGGFAAVGGLSPASHRHGLFVDTIRSIKVARGGNLETIEGEGLNECLGATGLEGVIYEITCELIPGHKTLQFVRATWTKHESIQAYAADMRELIDADFEGPFQRGIWVRRPTPDFSAIQEVGFVIRYDDIPTPSVLDVRTRDEFMMKLQAVGREAGRLDPPLTVLEPYLKQVGIRLALSPHQVLTRADVESLLDQGVDLSIGPPTTLVGLFVPVTRFEEVLTAIENECRDYNELASFGLYSRVIKSPYLSDDDVFFDITILLVFQPNAFAAPRFDTFVASVDGIAEQKGCMRYMGTKTSFRPQENDPRNPHTRHRAKAEE